MSRLTGADAYSLMEAYQAVYAPQELTEEQVWQEVENWVNSLVEEGYDLSDYTWEEMYESYLEEINQGMPAFEPAKPAKPLPSGNFQHTRATGRASSQTRNLYRSSSDGKVYKNYNDALAARNSRVPPAAKPATTSTATTTSAKPATSTPAAAPAKPAAPASAAARPSAGAPAKVSPTPTKPAGPAMGKLGGTTFERRTPTSAELKAAQAARAGGEKNPEKVLQAAKAASTPAAKVTPATTLKKEDFDVFDVIKGHLIDEGYADTEESALAIMANMSEEWRQSIVEGFPNVQNNPRPGDAGTSGLKMIQTPGGQRGYINKHSGGEILPLGTVNKIMGGNLMVKNGTKKNTNSNIA